MHKWLWFGVELKDFLFYGYDITTTWGLLSTCLGLVALGILYEAMKLSQAKLRAISKQKNQIVVTGHHNDSSSLLSRVSKRSHSVKSLKSDLWLKWIVEVIHWSLQVGLGYILMLSIMSFNIYMMIAIAIGSGIGYYIFGPIWFEWNIEKIQRRKRLLECNPVCADSPVYVERNELALSITSEHSEEEEVNNISANVEAEVHYRDEI
ncbi:hypothetical protein TKK_0003847 [Trichogramma kaykai]|uniref:Copper transport protein n=1 Tax=Trichogramma kaykai TaxID=54128 RepID=A0ABD2XNC8_9HYME